MRISIFSAFYPFRGGIAQFNARLYRSLEKEHQVSTFTFTKQYPTFLFPGKTQYVDEKDRVDAVEAERIVNPFNPFSYFGASRKIRESNPEIFISNYWMTFFGFCFGYLARRQSKNTIRVALVHNLIPHEPRFFDKIFSRYYVKSQDVFIVMSDAVEKDLLRLKSDARYIKIQHPWYDHFGEKIERNQACENLSITAVKINVLFFGLIRDYKGLDMLLEAFDLLSDEYQLIIAGEVYGDSDKYKQKIVSSVNSERILFHDHYIADEEVKNYFSAADLCVLPYKSATQSGITAAAFHFEVPVVVTDVGGLRETVEAIGAGQVVLSAIPNLLKEGIEKLSKIENLDRCRMNLRQAKHENSWDNFSKKLIEFVSVPNK
jgi:glycosyltransferase involved in cell wall biosynthesis